VKLRMVDGTFIQTACALGNSFHAAGFCWVFIFGFRDFPTIQRLARPWHIFGCPGPGLSPAGLGDREISGWAYFDI
jgi:hypothetical protein